MNNSKKINVNYSSLVGLKAELLRKQNEVKNAKVKEDGILDQVKHKIKEKKPKTKKLKIEKELIDTDDINAHKKSKIMLEAKARLYENLKKSHSNKNEHFLVDFQNKSESEDEIIHSDDYEDVNSDPEEDWVEYEDCFGRTRKCLRRDLPRMQEKDNFVKDEVMKKSQADVEVKDVRAETIKIIPKEPEIEIMRRKWEEQTEKLTEKVNIHYQDVLFDEARAHGVGYYEFSQDEEVRAKQQRNLDTLRKETIEKQKEMQNLKELRDKMEQNRLKAAKIRQRIRAGLPPEPTEEELVANSKSDEDNKEIKPKTEEEEEESDKNKVVAEYKEQDSLIEIENKIEAFGKLLGKRTQWHEMSQEEWVHKRRKDRNNEFAPLYSDFKSAGYLEAKNDDPQNYKATNSFDDDISDRNLRNDSESEISSCNEESKKQKNSIHNSEAIYNIDDESLDSKDSDIIGPMPVQTELPEQESNIKEVFSGLPESVRTELSHIDFSKPPPNMRIETTSSNIASDMGNIMPNLVPPLPPYPMGNDLPVPELSNLANNSKLPDTPQVPKSSRCSLDENNIITGLKYLRENFERNKRNS